MEQIFQSSYLIYIIVAVFLVFTFLPIIKKVMRFRKEFFGKIYLNKSSKLTQEQYKKLSIGAIYSEQQYAYINSLTTGMDKNKLDTITGQWWGINSPDEAMDTLEYLQKKGSSFYFPTAYEAFLVSDEEEKKNIIINNLAPDRPLTE